MTTLKVPDMHCNMCVKRITDTLNNVNLKFTVSLDDKTVTIDGDEAAVATAKSELDEIGFPVEE